MDSTQTSRRGERDTGFPEPFNDDRNTTLPYPGADLSGNAVISMDSIISDPFGKSSRRSRLSKHKRAVSYGRIQQQPQGSAAQSTVSVIDTELSNSAYATDNSNARQHSAGNAAGRHSLTTPTSAAPSSIRTSKDDVDAFSIGHRDEETPPSSPDTSSHRKSGLFRRFRGLSRGG